MLSATQYARLAETLKELGLPAMTPRQANAIEQAIGLHTFARMVRDARSSGDAGTLETWVRAAKLLDRLATGRLGPLLESHRTMASVMRLLQTIPRERLETTVADAEHGDQRATQVLASWLRGEAAQEPTEHQPTHPTPLPPPQAQPAPAAPATPRTPAEHCAPREPVRGPVREPVRQPSARVPPPTVTPLHAQRPQDAHGTLSQMPTAAPTPGGRRYDEVKVFGRDRNGPTAMGISRSIDNRTRVSTINVGIARAKGSRTQDGCDWDNQLQIKLSPGEIIAMFAVLMGESPEARFAGHGPANDKWMTVQESKPPYAGTILVTLAQGQDRRACSITPPDLAHVLAIFSRAVADQTGLPQLTQREVLARVGPLDAAYRLAQAERKKQAG